MNVENINILGFIKILKLTLLFNINKINFIASGLFGIQHKYYKYKVLVEINPKEFIETIPLIY